MHEGAVPQYVNTVGRVGGWWQGPLNTPREPGPHRVSHQEQKETGPETGLEINDNLCHLFISREQSYLTWLQSQCRRQGQRKD